MEEVKTTPAKYIFLDIVGFTNNRSVEAQAEIVGILNTLVSDCLRHHDILEDQSILLPTGDGLCIALLNLENPFDIHIRLALSILSSLHKHNTGTDIRDSRKFEVRIGVSANTDNLVTDINGNQNIAGAGINTAQRVMDNADGSQILVSQAVYDQLQHRERYMESFNSFTATIKHGERVNVYQLLDETAHGLNNETPSAFYEEEPDNRLTKRVAYYFAHAIVNRENSLAYKGSSDEYGGVILLYFKAEDSEAVDESQEFTEPVLKTFGVNKGKTFSEQYAYYSDLWMWVKSLLHTLIVRQYLWEHNHCFERKYSYSRDFRFVNREGRDKLKDEWPKIWAEFELDKYV